MAYEVPSQSGNEDGTRNNMIKNIVNTRTHVGPPKGVTCNTRNARINGNIKNSEDESVLLRESPKEPTNKNSKPDDKNSAKSVKQN